MNRSKYNKIYTMQFFLFCLVPTTPWLLIIIPCFSCTIVRLSFMVFDFFNICAIIEKNIPYPRFVCSNYPVSEAYFTWLLQKSIHIKSHTFWWDICIWHYLSDITNINVSWKQQQAFLGLRAHLFCIYCCQCMYLKIYSLQSFQLFLQWDNCIWYYY